ncbi:hypothetical protein CQW23_10562 [Capsicum baccatum]|uniref:F-box domain-containing protein n=1 Tax=Capsicum baccatum TaxID=33114 RepID=A0A2G2X030_CAPBA|nr:hypothetical protein CQW23_10562 [Capsicum baccatum]
MGGPELGRGKGGGAGPELRHGLEPGKGRWVAPGLERGLKPGKERGPGLWCGLKLGMGEGRGRGRLLGSGVVPSLGRRGPRLGLGKWVLERERILGSGVVSILGREEGPGLRRCPEPGKGGPGLGKSKNIIEENVVVKPSKNITEEDVVVKPSKSITEEDVVEKPSKNIIEEEVVLKPSKSINQIDVNPAMEIYFPEEIIMDILIRLPVQSLLRFKCASKFWKTLISDPSSKAKHNNHAKKNKRILIAQQVPGAGKSFYFYSLSSLSAQPLQKLCFPSTHKPQRYVILCCCDGLCLLWSCSGAGHLLWNPSTNESVELPDHEYPDATCSTYGLTFDSINDDYKILKIDNKGSLTSPNKIFALKSGCWRNIDNHPRGLVNGMRGDNSLAFVRGAFHWISKDNLSRYFMISLNISNEVYGEISLPEGICSRWICLKSGISVLQGMLCAYCTHKSPRGGCTFKLWDKKYVEVAGYDDAACLSTPGLEPGGGGVLGSSVVLSLGRGEVLVSRLGGGCPRLGRDLELEKREGGYWARA